MLTFTPMQNSQKEAAKIILIKSFNEINDTEYKERYGAAKSDCKILLAFNRKFSKRIM